MKKKAFLLCLYWVFSPFRLLQHVPFRESKLTHYLQGFLCGRGKVSMIVNINQCASMYDETLNVLKLSAVAQKVCSHICFGFTVGNMCKKLYFNIYFIYMCMCIFQVVILSSKPLPTMSQRSLTETERKRKPLSDANRMSTSAGSCSSLEDVQVRPTKPFLTPSFFRGVGAKSMFAGGWWIRGRNKPDGWHQQWRGEWWKWGANSY